jgi:hypothetical protein
MIVRVSGEDQYRLPDDDATRVQELEHAVAGAVQAGAQQEFEHAYQELLDFVRSNGQRLAEDELEPSDVILPPADITLEEAAAEFTGENLIPD